MDKALWADVIAVSHLAYFLFIVVGQLAIVLGIFLGWRWIRNFTFRITHLAAMSIVGLESVFGIQCPLTVWERALRAEAGTTVSDASFMARLANAVLFRELPPWVFDWAHIAFALVVLATFIWAPPRWPWRRKT